MSGNAPSFICSVRFLLTIIAFLGYAIQYTQKINMSVAIVCMINNTALEEEAALTFTEPDHGHELNLNISEENECGASVHAHKSKMDGPFVWNTRIQGLVLSAYFIGYLLSEIPGGYLSMKFGSKIVIGLAILIGSLLTIVLPFLARAHYSFLILCRFFIGLIHGALWPAFANFWASWAPPNERSRIIGIANAGSQIGNVIALPLGGWLCVAGLDGGWPSIFYLFGGVGVIWFVLWLVVASDSPDDNRIIRDTERDYVLKETQEVREMHEQAEKSTPWKAILTSMPAISIFVTHSCSNFGTYLFLTSLPTYMKQVLKFDIKSNGLLSAVPYLAFWLFIILSGFIGDMLIKKLIFKKTTVRKIFNSLSLLVPAASVLGLCFVTCSYKMVGVALLTIGLAFTGAGYSAGFMVNYNDIAGVYSGVVFGIGNTFATIPGIIVPFVVKLLTKHGLFEEWRIVFIITAVVYVVGTIFMLIFTSGSIQSWALASKKRVNGDDAKESVPLREQE